MQSLSLTISAQVSDEGTLYGSIGTREIADALSEKGYETEKSSVRLPEGVLKEVGEYSIDIDTPLDWEIAEFLMKKLL